MFEQIVASLVVLICTNCREYDLTYDDLCELAGVSGQFGRVQAIKTLRTKTAYSIAEIQAISLLEANGFNIIYPEPTCNRMRLKEAKELTEAIDMLWCSNKHYRVRDALNQT